MYGVSYVFLNAEGLCAFLLSYLLFFFLIIVFINSVLYLLVYLCVCFPVGVFFFFFIDWPSRGSEEQLAVRRCWRRSLLLKQGL